MLPLGPWINLRKLSRHTTLGYGAGAYPQYIAKISVGNLTDDELRIPYLIPCSLLERKTILQLFVF
jgi:hypothetical protein